MKKLFSLVLCVSLLISVIPVFTASADTAENLYGWTSKTAALEVLNDSSVNEGIKISKTVNAADVVVGEPVILATKKFSTKTLYDEGPKGGVRIHLKNTGDRSWATIGVMVDGAIVAAIEPTGKIHAGVAGLLGGSCENTMVAHLDFKDNVWTTFRSDFENRDFGAATDIMVSTWPMADRGKEYHIAHIPFKKDGTENGENYKFFEFSEVSLFYIADSVPADNTKFELQAGGADLFGSFYKPLDIEEGWKVQMHTDAEFVTAPTASVSKVADKDRGEVIKVSKELSATEETPRYFGGYQKLITKDFAPVDLGSTLTDDLGWYADKTFLVDFWIKTEGREADTKDYGSLCVLVNEKAYVLFETDATLRKNGSSGYGYFVDRNDEDKVPYPDNEWRRVRFTLRLDNNRVATGDFTQTDKGVWKTNSWGGQYANLEKHINSISIGYRSKPPAGLTEGKTLSVYLDNFTVTEDKKFDISKNGNSYVAEYTKVGISGTPSRFNEEVKVIIAAYNEEGDIVDIKYSEADSVTVNNNNPTNAHGVCTGVVSVPIDVTDSDISYVRAYAWDSTSGMKPSTSVVKKNVVRDI